MKNINLLQRELSESEIQLINETKIKDRIHPAKSIITFFDSHTTLYHNTNNALSAVLQHDNEWFIRNKNRLLDIDDYSTSSSFLSEIRTYGSLISLGLNIKAIPETDKSTPDFEVLSETETEKVIIEVNTKQYNNEESQALEDFHNRKDKPPLQPGTNVDEHVITPFGKPEKNENVAENSISKLCAIKQSEKQFSKDIPCILWVDFQDELWGITLKPDSVFPVRSWNGGLYSGEIWYSLFGYKDAPIFDGQTTKHRHRKDTIKMKHKGRFRNESIVDAVIYSFLGTIIVIENPYSNKPIPGWFWEKILGLRTLSYEFSMFNWPNNKIEELVNLQTEKLNKLDKLDLYSW